MWIAAPAVQGAEYSARLAFTTDYRFDGVSQTRGKPAFQAGLEGSFRRGFYAGIWTSQVDFGSGDPARVEVDLYLGYRNSVNASLELDVGFVHYTYPGAPRRGYAYTEVFAGIVLREHTSWYVWVADDAALFGGRAWRTKVAHEFELHEEFRLGLEAGYTRYPVLDVDVAHYRIGISRPWRGFGFDLSWHGSDLKGDPDGRGTVVFSVSRGFDF